MRNILLLLAFLCQGANLFAQDFDHYRLLKNEGPIPTAFTTPSSEKYQAEILKMEKELKARQKKDQKQFYLETNYVIDDLLLSGKVLFGTEVNRYVEQVAAKVLEQVPELKDKVQFYILRSSAVNAFATQQGIIFINMGLLAQLENEAQLAFIIAHELSHVKRNHSLNKFLEKKNIDRQISRTQLLRQTDFDEALIAKSRYSKELEFEADNDGLEIYLKTQYSLAELDGVFDVLKYAHLLFDVKAFNENFFNIGTLVLPSSYFRVKLNTIEAIDDEDDTKSTHPAIGKRLEWIGYTIADKDNSGRAPYLVSQEEFLKIRKIARFELVYYYLHYFRYEDAIYTAYLLLQEHPQSEFLHKSIVQALHGMSKYQNAEAKEKEDSEYQRNNDTYKEIEGPQQRVYYLIEQLKNKEMTTLALRYTWFVHENFPNNKEVETILKDLFVELAYHYPDFSKFKKVSAAEVLDIASGKVDTAVNAQDSVNAEKKEEPKTEEVVESKYAKIKAQQAEKKAATPVFNFDEYAFGDLVELPHFKEHFEKGKEEHERIEKRRAYYESEEGKKAWAQELKQRKKEGLGIDSILVLNPYYLQMDNRKNFPLQYLETEAGQIQFKNTIQETAKNLDLTCIILDAEQLNSTSVDTFNDIYALNEWISQQSRVGDFFLPGFSQSQIDSIAIKYGTKYLLKTGMVVLRKKKFHGVIALSSITVGLLVFPITLAVPASIAVGLGLTAALLVPYCYLFFRPSYETFYFSILYDLNTQRYEVIKYKVKRNNGKVHMKKYVKKTLKKIVD